MSDENNQRRRKVPFEWLADQVPVAEGCPETETWSALGPTTSFLETVRRALEASLQPEDIESFRKYGQSGATGLELSIFRHNVRICARF